MGREVLTPYPSEEDYNDDRRWHPKWLGRREQGLPRAEVLEGHRPPTALHALMEAAPHDEPEESEEEYEARRASGDFDIDEVLADFDERERTIIWEICLKGRSYRSVARELKLNPRTVYDMLNGRESSKFPMQGLLTQVADILLEYPAIAERFQTNEVEDG